MKTNTAKKIYMHGDFWNFCISMLLLEGKRREVSIILAGKCNIRKGKRSGHESWPLLHWVTHISFLAAPTLLICLTMLQCYTTTHSWLLLYPRAYLAREGIQIKFEFSIQIHEYTLKLVKKFTKSKINALFLMTRYIFPAENHTNQIIS